MANMRKDKRLTSSDTRQARIRGTAGGSQPRPRPTQVSNMKQQGPLKPGTRTASNRANSPRPPNLPQKLASPPRATSPVPSKMSSANQSSPSSLRRTKTSATKGAGRMGGTVAGTLLAVATPSVRNLGTGLGRNLGRSLRPVGRAIDKAMGTKPKKKPKK